MVGLWLGSSSTAGYDSFGPPRDPPCRDSVSVAGGTWGGGESRGRGDDSIKCATAGDGDGDGVGDAEISVLVRESGGGGRRMTAVTGGLLAWALVASMAAVWLAAGRGRQSEECGMRSAESGVYGKRNLVIGGFS